MKLACAEALAALAKEPVAQDICDAYGVPSLEYGIDYIIPKPLDPRVLTWLAPAVAKAAMDTGVAQVKLDLEQYKKDLAERMAASKARTSLVVDSFNYDI
jgi:malate dehydrogenase (oxaloacetate-decarboxylating)(NADP+)